jgi:hypothetical protein
MATELGEYETGLESEFEGAPEIHEAHELESEEEFGNILGAIGNIASSLLGEEEVHEGELHEAGEVHEGAHEGAHEFEGEEFLSTIARGIGSLLGGQGEVQEAHELGEVHEAHELGEVHEYEGEYESEYESEQFFRRVFRGIGGFVRRAAPLLRRVAKVAAPLVGTAVGGPLGGMLGRAVSSQLETELEAGEVHEFETHEVHEAAGEAGEAHELGEYEEEFEGEFETETAEISPHEALAEMMAAVASRSASDAEAEAMTGAAAVTIVSPSDAAALRRILPHIVRGSAILTRILRQRRVTRPVIRAVPTIVRRTTQILARRAAAGQPVTRRTAARVMAAQTRRVMGNPRVCAAALRRNVRGTRAIKRARPRLRPRRVSM